MSLTKKVIIDRIEVTENGIIQIRQRTTVEEDGKQIGTPAYHRTALKPGVDTTGQPARVKAVAKAVWTPATITKFKEDQEAIRKAAL